MNLESLAERVAGIHERQPDAVRDASPAEVTQIGDALTQLNAEWDRLNRMYNHRKGYVYTNLYKQPLQCRTIHYILHCVSIFQIEVRSRIELEEVFHRKSRDGREVKKLLFSDVNVCEFVSRDIWSKLQGH